jgi:poly(U)-specific endoribonuclease
MRNNGLAPLIKGKSDNEKDSEQGYVIVDMNPFSQEDFHRRRRNPHAENREVNCLLTSIFP